MNIIFNPLEEICAGAKKIITGAAAKSLFLYFLISILTAPAVYAQEKDSLTLDKISNLSLEDLLDIKVKVSASLPAKLYGSPSTVTVIDRNTIEKYNFLSVAEAIRIIAGVEVLQSNLDVNIPTFRGMLQNYYANKILLMINNIPTWQPIYGNGTIDRISINDIERIEVLKGPASVLYGTNAFTGVINIITREAGENSVNARLTAGIPYSGSAAVNLNYFSRDFHLFVSGSSDYETREPYQLKMAPDITKYGQTERYGKDTLIYFGEDYRKYSINLFSSYKGHSLFLNYFGHSYNIPGVSLSFATGSGHPLTDRGTMAGYKFETNLNDKTKFLLNLNYDYYWRFFTQNADATSGIRFSADRYLGAAKLIYSFNETISSEIGGDIQQGNCLGHYAIDPRTDAVTNVNLDHSKSITEWSMFLQTYFDYGWLTFSGGLRYTGNETFGNHISARLSANLNINRYNTVRINFGQSFRTPNLLELYFSHWTIVGNPSLNPEKNNTFEISYSFGFDNFLTQITGYYSAYSNLIQRIRTSENLSVPATYRNVSDFDAKGIEIELRYNNPEILNGFANYTYMKGEGSAAYSNFRFIPAHTISAGVNKSFDAFFASANVHGYSETDGLLERIPFQLLADIHFGFKHKFGDINLTHTVSIKNLTGSDMLIPEYIRQRPNINSLPTAAFGRRIVYSLNLNI